MSEAPEAGVDPAPRASRRGCRPRFVRGSAVLLAVLVLLGAFRNQVIAPLVVGWLASAVEDAGGELQVASVSGSWFSSLELAGVGYRGPVGDNHLRVEGARVRAEFSLVELFQGEDGWLHRLEVDAVLVDHTIGEGPPASWSVELPLEALPEVDLRLERFVLGPDILVLDDAMLTGAEPDDLRITASRLEVPGVTFGELTASAGLERSAVMLAELAGGAYGSRIELTDVHFPLVEETALENLRRARARIRVSEVAFGLLPFASDLDTLPAGAYVNDLVGGVEGELRDAELALAGRFDTPHGAIVVERARFRPFEETFGEGVIEGELGVDLDDVVALAEAFDLDATGTLRVQATASGTIGEPHGVIEGTAEALAVEGVELGAMQWRLALEGGQLALDSLEVENDGWEATARGRWDLDLGELGDLRVEARTRDVAKLTQGVVEAGEAQLELTAAGPPDGLRAEARLSAAGLRSEELDAEDVEVVLALDGETIRVETLSLVSSEGSLDARAQVEHDGSPFTGWEAFAVRLDALRAVRDDEAFELVRPARFAYSEDGLRVDDLELAGEMGRLSASAVDDAEGLRVEVTAERFDPMPFAGRFLPEGVRIRGLDGTLSLVRAATGTGPTIFAVDMQVAELVPGPGFPAWSAAARATLAGGRLRVEELEVDQGELGELRVEGEAPLDPLAEEPLADGDLSLSLSLQSTDIGDWSDVLGLEQVDLDGGARIEIDLGGSWRRPTGDIRADVSGIRMLDVFEAERAGVGELSLELELGEEIRLRAGSVRAEEVELVFEGRLGHALDLVELVDGELDPLLDAPLEASAELSLPRLGWLSNPRRGLRRLRGRFGGELSFAGTLRDPSVSGDLTLEEGELRLRDPMPSLRNLSARLALDADVVRIEHLTGELGSAPFAVSGTTTLADPLEVDLSMRGENVLLYRDPVTRVRANADLRLAGPVEQLTLSGDVTLTEGRHTRDIDLLLSAMEGQSAGEADGFEPIFFNEPPLSDLRLDLAFHTDEPFVLRSNLVRGTLRPELKLAGTGELPTLDGIVQIDPTRLRLPSGWLDVQGGRVTFRREAPFELEVDLLGRMRIRGYEVTTHVTIVRGEPTIELSSLPPLPDDDLLLLFLTGQAPASQGGGGSQGAAESVAVFLTADYVRRWLGGTTDEDTFMDRFELDMSSEASSSGTQSLSLTYYLSPRPTGPGSARYLRTERDRFGATNFSYGLLFRFR